MNNRLLLSKKIGIDIKAGQNYQVILKSSLNKNSDDIRHRPFEGKLIQETDFFLTFKHSRYGYCESFLKVDFANGYYILKEKKGDGKWIDPLKVKY